MPHQEAQVSLLNIMMTRGKSMLPRLFYWLGPLLALSLVCCQREVTKKAQGFQGVIELDAYHFGFEASGRVGAVAVERGARVAPGELLASLEGSLLQKVIEMRTAEYKVANAQLSLLQAGARTEDVAALSAKLSAAKKTEATLQTNLTRQKRLVAEGAATAVSLDSLTAELSRAQGERKVLEQQLKTANSGARPEELEAGQARIEGSKAALALEEERLARYSIYSTTKGRVIEVNLKPGEIIAAGMPVITIADTTHPYVDIFVPQGDTAGILLGLHATVRVDAQTEPFEGYVEGISHQVEFTPRFLFSERERPNLVIRVKIRINDPKELLLAGLPAFVTLDKGAPP
jgi:HlyD family secretion protein